MFSRYDVDIQTFSNSHLAENTIESDRNAIVVKTFLDSQVRIQSGFILRGPSMSIQNFMPTHNPPWQKKSARLKKSQYPMIYNSRHIYLQLFLFPTSEDFTFHHRTFSS